VSVTYSGPNGYRLAWQKADSYCVAHYGNTRVELLANDEAAGRATFGCNRI
jgi:alkanesulfonate monooxygenase SsuD/methylene tetrahydromethanopterin reductase-like flavin-dependent oxidoreductase (luciferase family)